MNNPDKWSLTPRVCFHVLGVTLNVSKQISTAASFKGLNLVKSYFWGPVLVAWLDDNLPNCKERIITLLWNNEYVSCSGEVLHFKEWAVNDILFVNDSVTPKGLLSFQEIIM